MSLKTIKLIVADLDGTLLHDDKSLDRNIKSVLIEKNVPLTFVSGRNVHIIQDYIKELNITLPYITNNGANMFLGDTCIYECPIDSSELKTCLNILVANKVALLAYTNQTIYSVGYQEGLDAFKNRLIGKCEIVEDANIEDIVSQVVYACSMDDRRPALTGVHLQTKNSTLLVMASDSYRLAMKKIELNQMVNMDVIVPKKAFIDILKCTNTTTEKIQVYYDTHKIQFYFDDILIQTTLINGTFPNVQRIVPKEFECKLKTTVDTILPIIDRSQFIKDESKVHIVKVAMTDHDVHIKSKSSIIGNTDETLPNVELEGNPLNLSFNGKYLYEAIKGVQGDKQQLLLQFGGEYNPLLVTNPLDRSVCAICVPLRTYE